MTRGYTTDGLNQYSAAGAVAFGYDGRGNLNSSGSTIYGYSSENLMTAGASGGLEYDAALRLSETRSAVYGTTRFVYDGVDLVGEYDAANILQRRYVHGPGSDEPIVWYEGAGLSDKRFLHADERGSIIAISDASGSVTNINSYDDYGIPAATNLGRFGYTGQTWLPHLGMYYYKARIYSPTLGRFMQSDPIGYGDGPNLYNYVGSDPVNARDPSGLALSRGGCNVVSQPSTFSNEAGITTQGFLSCDSGGGGGIFRGGSGGGGVFGGGCDQFHETLEAATSACRGQPGGGSPQPREDPPVEPSTLENVWECTKDQYGFGGDDGAGDVALGAARAASQALATPIHKELAGVRRHPGTSRFTNALNYISHTTRIGAGVNFTGSAGRLSNLLTGTARVASALGRANAVTGALFAAYDTGSIAYCAYKKGRQ